MDLASYRPYLRAARSRGRRRYAGLGPGAADWKGLRETVRVGNTIAGVRACTLKVAGAEEYVYPLHYSGRTNLEAEANFRRIRAALGFRAQASGHPPFIDAAQLAALPADSWAYVQVRTL